MTQILFIGAFEKSDLLFYIAKVLSRHHRVAIIDVTANGDYRYTYPKVPEQAAPFQHDHFDVYENMTLEKFEQMKNEDSENYQPYDYYLIDISYKEELQRWPDADHYYLVTSHDNAVMQRNTELMNAFFEGKSQSELIPFYKLIQAATNLTEEAIEDLFTKHPIDWKDTFTFYPDERDLESKYYNQHLSELIIKKLSPDLKLALQGVISMIYGITAKQAKGKWQVSERGR